MITESQVIHLENTACSVRISIVEMLAEAGSGHTAGALGMADIFTLLYFHTLRYDPEKPDWDGRDRLVLSNGHICPVQYAAMAHAGCFDISELKTLRKLGSRLQGHPHREYLPGIETSSGPLGSGLSQALGMALADRIDNGRQSHKFFYCLMGDGELNEGQAWEAALHAGKEKTHNLIAFVDRNDIQIDGYTQDVMPLEPLKDKWETFGWHVQEVDGHDIAALDTAIELAKAVHDKPSMIIAITIPGKGVIDWERKPEWHGKAPKKDEATSAIKELQVGNK